MDNVEKFNIEYNRYVNNVYYEQNRRENIVGWIQGLIVLSAIVFPILAIILSPQNSHASPLRLLLIVATTTLIGIIFWKKFESTTDFTEEKVEKVELDFQNRFCPDTIKTELIEKYKARIMQIEAEVVNVENKKVYYKMIEGLKSYQDRLNSIKFLNNITLTKKRYNYYILHQYIYFYHMFDSVKTFRNRDENHFATRYD